MKYIFKNEVVEIILRSSKKYKNPFNDVEVDFIFEYKDGERITVPAFWDGEYIWKVRFSSEKEGKIRYVSVCNDKTNTCLLYTSDAADE